MGNGYVTLILARPIRLLYITRSSGRPFSPKKQRRLFALASVSTYSMPGRPGLWSWLQVTVIVRLVGLWGGQGHPHPHSRRMETEGTAKVVASVWGTKFVQFLATLPVLPRSNWKKRCRSIWKTRLNSTLSFISTKTKQTRWPLPLLLFPPFFHARTPPCTSYTCSKENTQF